MLENLFVNALKYALGGHEGIRRPYDGGNDVKFTITNVSADEINYTAEEIWRASRAVTRAARRKAADSGSRSRGLLHGTMRRQILAQLDGDMFAANSRFRSFGLKKTLFVIKANSSFYMKQ